jgi:hypothetical protein
LNELARQLRKRAETRDALQRVYKLSVLELEQQWKAWVVANYPLR